jgi:2,4-dienoyl-CoA reductase (NADPH2)
MLANRQFQTGEAMSMQNPAVAASMAQWHRMIANGDLGSLHSLLHPDALFRSPMAFKPYRSAQAVALILNTVFKVFSNFEYHREFMTDDGQSAVLEFSANVGDKQLKGVDVIRFDADGKIIEFEVMVRPMSGLQALGEEMGKRLGALLPAYKAGQIKAV